MCVLLELVDGNRNVFRAVLKEMTDWITRYALYAVNTIAIRLQYDYETTTIRLRCIARACFHSTRFDASKKK